MRPRIFTCLGVALFVGLVAHAPAQTLFAQPVLSGIAGNFLVPTVTKTPPPLGRFSLILWQPNPNRADGALTPSQWAAGDKTGFYPSEPVSTHQASFADKAGSTTAQVEGGTVAAYLNSADLPQGSHQFKMMITPQIRFAQGEQSHPFADPKKVLVVSLDLQVPTAADANAKGSNTYVVPNLLFADQKNKARISYGSGIFFNRHAGAAQKIAFDAPSHSMMVNQMIGPESPWSTLEPDSAPRTGEPWKGWRHFSYSISRVQFSAALKAVADKEKTFQISTDPADWTLEQFHLNAELHFETGAAELGWSMRNAYITLRQATDL